MSRHPQCHTHVWIIDNAIEVGWDRIKLNYRCLNCPKKMSMIESSKRVNEWGISYKKNRKKIELDDY